MDSKRFFGGRPLTVLIRLALISIVVGVVLSTLDLKPSQLIEYTVRLVHRIYDLGLGAFESVFRYLLVGAIVVVPVWLIARFIASWRRTDEDRHP